MSQEKTCSGKRATQIHNSWQAQVHYNHKELQSTEVIKPSCAHKVLQVYVHLGVSLNILNQGCITILSIKG